MTGAGEALKASPASWKDTMHAITTQDVRHLMRAYVDSLALNTALELGLFWHLADRPQTAEEVAAAFAIPAHRSGPWLEMLTGLGFLEHRGGCYATSDAARAAILEAFSRACWAHLAEEERYRYPFGVDLSRHIGHPFSVWAGQSRMPHDYLRSIAEDEGFAWRFTHMLYELHLSLAETVAAALELAGAKRIMDLGGGSGVVALALLRRHPELKAVVVDHPHVCAAGQALADARPEGERLAFAPGDFNRDPLPQGCDLALQCDVGVYSEALFRRVREALNSGGRLVVVDEFATRDAEDGPMQRRYAFYRAMTDFPAGLEHGRPSIAQVQVMMARAGFRLSVEQAIGDGMVMLQGVK
jgi:predicted O-methyltransferase YrrM